MSRFKHDWRITLLTVVLLPLFLYLGFWQLHRADLHKAMQLKADEKHKQAPAGIASIPDWHDVDAIHYLPVSLKGEWLPQEFLLDNQVREQKVGYDVIGLMKLDDGRYVFVDRGWIAGSVSRASLPAIPEPVKSVTETGEIYASQEVMKDGDIFAESGWPRRIARVYVPALAKEVQLEVLPALVRLRAGSPSALVTGWPVTNISPEKNIAYAIQWFAMAIALIVFYLALVFRREISNGDNGDE